MADFKKVIDEKSKYAHFMAEGITHICKNLPKRDPGSEGEKLACEYMGDVLKNECGCEYTKLESFKENPGSFFGWIYFKFLHASVKYCCYDNRLNYLVFTIWII